MPSFAVMRSRYTVGNFCPRDMCVLGRNQFCMRSQAIPVQEKLAHSAEAPSVWELIQWLEGVRVYRSQNMELD